MNENKSPRKELIKNIAIIFLAVLLVLTFFSNTIMNYSLPQVTAVYASQGTLSEQIRGSGSIAAAEQYEVKTEQSRGIKSVAVSVGQTVSAGDMLFELDSSESSELKEAQNTLDSLELEYQKALLAAEADYSDEYFEISKAENELEKYKEQYQASEDGTDILSSAINEYEKAEKLAKQYESKVKELNTQLSSLDTTDMLELDEEYYNRLLKAQNNVTLAEEKESDAQKNYDEAAKNYSGNDYSSDIASLQDEISDAKDAISDLYFQYYSSMMDADAAATIMTEIKAQEKAVKKLERQLSELTEDSILDTNAKNKLSFTQRKLNEAQDNVVDAKKTLSELTRTIKLEIKADIDKYQEKLDAANEKMAEYKEIKEQAEAMGMLSKTQLAVKIKEQEDKIEELNASLELKKNKNSLQSQSDKLDLDAKEKKLEQQKELVEELKEQSDGGSITAKVSGIISSISVTAGDTAAAGSSLCVIDVDEKGYVIEFPVKLEQAKKVKVGDKAEVTSWYWGSEFTATLSEIRPDTSNPQTQKILVFNITGDDITSGQTLTLSLGSKGQQYSTVVPNAAIREDSNGKYVLVMESKSSALGNRYKAVRYDVDVIAKDDNNTAVNGLMGNEFVITASTDPISAGDQVRPAD